MGGTENLEIHVIQFQPMGGAHVTGFNEWYCLHNIQLGKYFPVWQVFNRYKPKILAFFFAGTECKMYH